MRKPKQVKLVALLSSLAVLAVVVLVVRNTDWITAWWEFRSRFKSLGTNDKGLVEYRDHETAMMFVRVPGTSEVEPFLLSGSKPAKGILRRRSFSGTALAFRGEVQNVFLDRDLDQNGLRIPTVPQLLRAREVGLQVPLVLIYNVRDFERMPNPKFWMKEEDVRLAYYPLP
jgi:hypothetical protein